jgi:hypothetical protein
MTQASDSKAELASAIDGLYRTFARYRLRPHTEGCADCVSESDHALIHAAPLRELTSRHLGKYGRKALTTWGNVNDFKHFLPRLLELMVVDAEWPVEQEIVAGKLLYASWATWPAAEKDSLHQFFEAWWNRTLSAFPAEPPIEPADTTLCAIGRAVDELAPYLNHWLERTDSKAARHLADFVIANYESLAKKQKLANPFWQERETQRNELEQWLRSGKPQQLLKVAIQQESDPELIMEFQQAIDCLDWLD